MIKASIDLMNGKAVQLVQGREIKIQVEFPIRLAEQFSGCAGIAVIDLDAALGRGNNLPLVKEICQFPDCRVGGGIRTVDLAKKIISWGAEKVIVATRVFERNRIQTDFLDNLRRAIGKHRIIVALDTRENQIVCRGWRHHTGIPLYRAARMLEPLASEFLVTFVEREGSMQGTDIQAACRLRERVGIPITVAGGVNTLDEVKKLSRFNLDVQLGMALYTGKIKLEQAFVESLQWKRPLIPVIAVDEQGQVLMLAYVNKTALRETLATGSMCYFSRSRNRLWRKGETSGNIQQLIRIRSDCDQDALLAMVRQTGTACHTGRYSCFSDRPFTLQQLQQIIRKSIQHPRPGSYTASLNSRKLKAKIREEASEIIQARGLQQVIWEAADLFYFITVLLEKTGADFDAVLKELRRRRLENENFQ